MPLYITREETQLVISGKTFEAKEAIKGLGGTWDATRRLWTLPLELDTEETRTRLGVLTDRQQEVVDTAMDVWREAVLAAQKESRAKRAKKEEKRQAAEEQFPSIAMLSQQARAKAYRRCDIAKEQRKNRLP
jgi:hypothetical protein